MRYYRQRLKNLQAKLHAEKVAVLLVSTPSNIKYLTGLDAVSHIPREFFIAVTPQSATLFISPLKADIINQIKHLEVLPIKKRDQLKNFLSTFQTKEIRFEADDLHVSELNKLQENSIIKFLPANHNLEDLRAIKDEKEIKAIAEACRITAKTWDEINPYITPGKSEVEIATRIIDRLKINGAQGIPAGFDPIVASGTHSATPHHTPTTKKIGKNEVVLVDFGCTYQGYCSDMTRTTYVGRPSKIFTNVERAVQAAYQRGLIALAKFPNGHVLDQIVRGELSNSGQDQNNMIHATGHGLGLDIHESPHIAPHANNPIKPNMVITIEPGLYFPGNFGYRYEDTILITKSGGQILTQ